MEVKICGITKAREIDYLNRYMPDYTGFVFFPKSKRNISIEDAKKLIKALKPEIKKVGVTVSPDLELALEIQKAGFDIIQVHGELRPEIIDQLKIPIWYAFNISNQEEIKSKQDFLEALSPARASKIEALVVDGAKYGSGETFNWTRDNEVRKLKVFKDRKFILAGGLNVANLKDGIDIFSPDTVDVSSGVEGIDGKEESLIKDFIERARNNE